MGTPLKVTASASPVSGERPTATATVSSRFDPVVVTVWLQLSAAPLDTNAPLALGPTASTVTPTGDAVTVKRTPLLACPPTVTTTFPVVAPVGTTTVRLVALQLIDVARVPLNVTVLVPFVAPRFAPVIVTAVPTGPDGGLSVVIDGGTVTVNGTPLLARPPTVTTTLPVVAPVGTGTTMLVGLQLVGVASVPLNVTVLVPFVAPKFAPVIVTAVPTGPDVGLSVVIDGGTVTVKGTPLLATPPTVTTTLPVVAPLGTGTVRLVALQLLGVASVPLNATVLVPCVAPKFVPAIVTAVPTGPDVGLSVLIDGGTVTVKGTPLQAGSPTGRATVPGRAAAGTRTA